MFMFTLVLPSLFVSFSCHARLYTLLLRKSGIWPYGKYTDKSKFIIGLKFKSAAKSWASVIWPWFTEVSSTAMNCINRRIIPPWLPSYDGDDKEILKPDEDCGLLLQQNEVSKNMFPYATFYK